MPTEKELDRALHESLEKDSDFRAWFISQLSFGAKYPVFVSCRSDHPWGKFRAILPDPKTGALRVQVREAETDLFLLLAAENGRRLGVHIENKKLGRKFTDNQPELYAARAEAWRGSKHHGGYDEWETVFVAPAAAIAQNNSQAMKFLTRVTYEQLARWVPSFSVSSPT